MAGNTVAFGLPLNDFAQGARILIVCSAAEQRRMKKITGSNYKKDKLYPAVARAVAEIMKTEDVITTVDVLMRMNRVDKKAYEDWRFGRIPYLEKVFLGSLGKANRILRILRLHAESLQLVPSQTVYRKWGKGKKRIILRFSKSGHPNLEKAYSTHYLIKSRMKESRPKEIRKDSTA